jgi:cysteinyl-tRNA synthetase
MTPGASLLDAIGNTPLVEIRRMNPNPRVRLYAKLEYLNPGGSIKDRPARFMIEAAERSGELTAGKTVVEATSGNTGIGLALVCAVKGYRLLLAMSESVSLERRRILKARGAEIMLTPGHLGTDGAIEEVYRLARENPERYFVVDQFNNPANWQAHYFGTAEEIWRQTEGRLDVFVAAMGTTGTLMGASRRLKELDPRIAIVGVEPYLGHKLQGLKNLKEAYCPEIFEKSRLDRKVNIADEEAFDTARRLAREEGLLVGMSSGAAMAAAVKEAARLEEGVVVVVLPDGGERYLSTPLFGAPEKLPVNLFNFDGRRRQPLEPARPDTVAVYTCGSHAGRPLRLGELRRFLLADVLVRYLRFRGFSVKHVVDIPDVDDSPPGAASENGAGPLHPELADLGVRPADAYLRAADRLEEMVAAAERLAAKGAAYEKLRSLYFDLSKTSGYGRLSGVDAAKVRVGATIDLENFEKANPRDFALLKRCRLSELKRGLFVKSPWGNVRPAWHLQTAAMVLNSLGGPADVHISSRELVFPHHENENAIAAALTGKPFARIWVLCDRVRTPAESLAELRAQGFSGREIRFGLLAAHYRKPAHCSAERLTDARRALERLDRCVAALAAPPAGGEPAAEVDQLVYDLRAGVCDALDDDLDLPAAIAALFRAVKRINALAASGRLEALGAGRLLAAFREIDGVLAVFDFGSPQPFDAEVQALIERRRQARAARDWVLADRLREELKRRGVAVRDEKLAR